MTTAPAFPDAAIAAARDAAKAYLRVTLDDEDALIGGFAASALAMAEGFCDRALVARDFVAILGVARHWQLLPMGPVSAIGAVQGLPAEGAAFDLPVGAYAIDIDAGGDGWVRVRDPGAAGRVQVTYNAGWVADWGGLPAPVAQGVVRLIAHLHGERDGVMSAPPAAVTALWRPYRRVHLAEAARC
jgi:uncharacterized phiE125 gp8 family phage protein